MNSSFCKGPCLKKDKVGYSCRWYTTLTLHMHTGPWVQAHTITKPQKHTHKTQTISPAPTQIPTPSEPAIVPSTWHRNPMNYGSFWKWVGSVFVLGEGDESIQGPVRRNIVNQNFSPWLFALLIHTCRTPSPHLLQNALFSSAASLNPLMPAPHACSGAALLGWDVMAVTDLQL